MLMASPVTTPVSAPVAARAAAARRRQILAWGLGLVALAVFPFMVYPLFAMKVLCFALFACSFNLLFGFAGLLSFGHAAYFGIASYVTAESAKYWGLTPELSILAGTGVAIVLGAAFGWLAIRRQGIYFSMITLALAQMVFFFCLQAEFTGGEDGIQSVPRGDLFGLIPLGSHMAMYYFVMGVFLIGFLIIYRTINSPFGQVLRAVRDNDIKATSLGIKTRHVKLAAFVISAGVAGLGGATKALVFQLASLTDVSWQASGEAVLMTVLGGAGTLTGPVMGALIVTGMQQYLAQFGSWVTIIQGAIFVVCVLAFRRGIVGVLDRLAKLPAFWRRRRAAQRFTPAPRASSDF